MTFAMTAKRVLAFMIAAALSASCLTALSGCGSKAKRDAAESSSAQQASEQSSAAEREDPNEKAFAELNGTYACHPEDEDDPIWRNVTVSDASYDPDTKGGTCTIKFTQDEYVKDDIAESVYDQVDLEYEAVVESFSAGDLDKGNHINFSATGTTSASNDEAKMNGYIYANHDELIIYVITATYETMYDAKLKYNPELSTFHAHRVELVKE